MRAGGSDFRRFLLSAAAGLLLWQLTLWLWHFTAFGGIWMAKLFYTTEDFPVICAGALALICASLGRYRGPPPRTPPSTRLVVGWALAIALAAWAGHYLVFQGYALSRDEDMAQFAGFYLELGRLGVPIPLEWQPYARAMAPIFTSPYGAEHIWSSVYLPLNSAARAAVGWVDPNLAPPLFTALGLVSLWRVALRWFPDRPDAVWVTLAMGLSSAQLLTMAMTPYAAAAHFGLEMMWLALVLGEGKARQAGAALLLLLATGLHQWHYTPLFVLPFLLWLLLQRRWGVAVVQAVALCVAILFWIKVWPQILEHVNGAAAATAAPPRASITAKVMRLFDRLGEIQPLFSLARFMAWNNLLLLPLGVLALPTLWQRWRGVLRGKEPVLPLLMAVALGLGLMLYQKHGWGYRYFHALIGPFCLLAGFGWMRLVGSPARLSLRLIWISCGIAAASAAFLLVQAHRWVAPYAAAYAEIRSARADVVLVDWRGGLYGQDLVRFESGAPGRPVIMDLYFLNAAKVDALCRDHNVAVYDWRDFRPLGLPATRPDHYLDGLRAHMAESGCGHRIAEGPK